MIPGKIYNKGINSHVEKKDYFLPNQTNKEDVVLNKN